MTFTQGGVGRLIASGERAAVAQDLGAAVSSWCAAMGLPHLSLVVIDATRTQTCFYGAAAGKDAVTPVTCLAKPLTMLLIQKALAERRIDLAAPFEAPGAPCIRDLISHTHGVDGDDVAFPPRLGNGRIDARALLAGVQDRPLLHAPGAAHSYSDYGYWLLGAALEQAYDRAFGLLLTEFLTGILGADARARLSAGAGDYCPAQGGGLALTALDLAEILRFYLFNSAAGMFDPHRLTASLSSFPGWTAADDGFALGWRYHGAGWFGHSARESLEQIALVRFNPEAGVGMAIVSSDGRAFLLGEQIAALLAPAHGHAARRTAPMPVEPPLDPGPYCGAFINGAMRLDVSIDDEGQFHLVRRGRGTVEQWRLRWAQNQTAFVTQPGLGAPYYIQYLGASSGEGYPRLWTGSRLWRRLPRASRAAG